MPKNKITDLNDHLFLQLERLNDDELKGEDLQQEIERSKAIGVIASQIVGAAKVSVDAAKLYAKGMVEQNALPDVFSKKMIG